MWPERSVNPLDQARQLLRHLADARVQYDSIMLDIEGSNWINGSLYTAIQNQDFVMALVNAFAEAGVPVAIYCSGSQFNQTFGSNFTSLSRLPLIYAHYDNIPSYVDIADSPFGGWPSPSGKQFFDGAGGEQICGSGVLDWDWSREPWW